MLKVVGASWLKTRISTYILLGAGLLAIGTLFIAEMDRPQFDGTYCATIFWSKHSGFRVEYWKQRNDFHNIPKGVARTCYKDSTMENGWSQLEVETQRQFPDWVQAFAAGMLEGSLTWRNIHHQWSNTISHGCDRSDDSQNFCTWLRDILITSYEKTKEMAELRANLDHYWHQIRLFFYQLEGLQAGWKKGVKRSRADVEIPPEDFLLMNAAGDIKDLKIYFDKVIMKKGDSSYDPSLMPKASMVLKLSRSNESAWNLMLGHSSAGSFSSMLRIHKRYKLNYHFSPDLKTHTVPGSDITFTSYPGILASTDDFYIIKGRHVKNIHLLVTGIDIQNNNLDLWQGVNLQTALPLSARVMAANRLAHSSRHWANQMSKNAAKGNKQWLIVDLKKLEAEFSDHSSHEGFLMTPTIDSSIISIVEQYPNIVHVLDLTKQLKNNKNIVWFSQGMPTTKELQKLAHISSEPVGWRSIKNNLTNLESIETFLRNHATRGDLFREKALPYGNIDLKVFSYNIYSGQTHFYAIAGPQTPPSDKKTSSHDSSLNGFVSESLVLGSEDPSHLDIISEQRPVRGDIREIANLKASKTFKWSNLVNELGHIPHEGHPDVWSFGKVSPKWAWQEPK
uniref:Phospholipase B-like n=1 Tax=Tabanus bromius TaxID=304241 RepID=A0A0K8TK86_TABBR